MMKPYSEIYSLLNLWQAFQHASKGRHSKPVVAAFEYDLERNLLELRDELRGETYQPGAYDSFVVHETKKRKISAAPFRDRVVHHALINVIGPALERKFIYDSYANRVGKGTHSALDRCTYFMRRHTYVLPCDVTQFFPAIDHQILGDILSRAVKDEKTMKVINLIIASGNGILRSEYDMVYFQGDTLFDIYRPRGLPIGNLTSQFWANVYLNELDQFVKRKLKVSAYLRYVDDFLLFSDDKAQLKEWRTALIDFLAGLRLTLHENSAQAQVCRQGIPFLGFTVFPDHRRLKASRGYSFRRHLRSLLDAHRVGDVDGKDVNVRVQAWLAHVKHGDTYGLRRSVLASENLLYE